MRVRLKSRRRALAALGAVALIVTVTSRAGGSSRPPVVPGPHDEASARQAGTAAGPAPGGGQDRSFQAAGPPPPPANSPQVPWATFRVYATQYAPNTSGSVEVAVPDKCVKFAALGDAATVSKFGCGSGYPLGLDYRVLITRDNGQSAFFPVKEVGPWNIDDNYWDPPDSSFPRPRRMFTDLARGLPESQAAFYNGYHTVSNCKDLNNQPTTRTAGADQFDRCVLNPSAVDLSIPAAAQLGISGSEWLTASFVWEPLDGLPGLPRSAPGRDVRDQRRPQPLTGSPEGHRLCRRRGSGRRGVPAQRSERRRLLRFSRRGSAVACAWRPATCWAGTTSSRRRPGWRPGRRGVPR